jgi:hypothetical protein
MVGRLLSGVPIKAVHGSRSNRTNTDSRTVIRESFVQLVKTWTARVYYSTQIGEAELNKGGRFRRLMTSRAAISTKHWRRQTGRQ